MSRAIQQEKREYVRQIKTADALILQNESGQSVTLPRDASAWQRREAIKQLQPQRDKTYDQPLVSKTAAKRDPTDSKNLVRSVAVALPRLL